jgi:hypothetical protein
VTATELNEFRFESIHSWQIIDGCCDGAGSLAGVETERTAGKINLTKQREDSTQFLGQRGGNGW